MSEEKKKRKLSASEKPNEKKGKNEDIVVKLVKRGKSGGHEAIWSIIDYVQKQVKDDKKVYSAWHSLDTLTACTHGQFSMLLCAFQGDKVVGFLCGHARGKNSDEVQMLEVFPEFRKKGVGTKLVRAAEKEIACAHRHGDVAWSGQFADDYACCDGSPMVRIPSILEDAKEFWTKLGYRPCPFNGFEWYRMVGYQLPKTFPGRYGIPMYQRLSTFTADFKHRKFRKEAGFDVKGSEKGPIEYHIYSSCFSAMIMLPHPRDDNAVGYRGSSSLAEHKELKDGEFFVSVVGNDYPDDQQLAAILVKEGVIECTKRTLMVKDQRVFVYRFSDEVLARFMNVD